MANGRIGVEDNYTGYHPNYQLKTNDNGEASDFSAMKDGLVAILFVFLKRLGFKEAVAGLALLIG